MHKKTLYIGQFNDACGYANAARKYLNIFKKNNISNSVLKALPINFENNNYASEEENAVIDYYKINLEDLQQFLNGEEYNVIVHLCTHIVKAKKILPIIKNANKRTNIIYWEADPIPVFWEDIYKENLFNNILVACSWNKEIFQKQTGINTEINYLPVESSFEYSPVDDVFRIFSMSQWQHRKGFDTLIKAYIQEFFYNRDTDLLIKTYRGETYNGSSSDVESQIIIKEAKEYKQSIHDYGNFSNAKISLVTGFLPKEEIVKLYKKSTVFCLPTRGEGFGLTIAQACVSGIPCIVPNKGGHIDYVNPDANSLFDSRFTYVENMVNTIYSKDMKYVEPDIVDLRAKLRYFYNLWKNNKQELMDSSVKTKSYAQKILSEDIIFNKLNKLLE